MLSKNLTCFPAFYILWTQITIIRTLNHSAITRSAHFLSVYNVNAILFQASMQYPLGLGGVFCVLFCFLLINSSQTPLLHLRVISRNSYRKTCKWEFI